MIVLGFVVTVGSLLLLWWGERKGRKEWQKMFYDMSESFKIMADCNDKNTQTIRSLMAAAKDAQTIARNLLEDKKQ